ncbi:MAG: insulinase family protein, partial [Oscillospiraceae bacterium]|nr:insulinase family protein [Oscillospiraceae bacterium]
MIETTALPGGARLVCEHMAYARSVALGIWVAGGVYDEGERNAGVTHALEHMVFKGTPRRTAAAVAADTDAIGGQVNAFTAKDLTGFYARCLNTHFPRALDLLGDIFFNALLEESDWEKERDVIIDEISLAKDNPEELVCDELYSAVYAGKPLGRPVPGTVAALESLTAADIAAHRLRTRFGPRVVVSLCGAYTPADRQAAEERFSVLAPS